LANLFSERHLLELCVGHLSARLLACGEYGLTSFGRAPESAGSGIKDTAVNAIALFWAYAGLLHSTMVQAKTPAEEKPV